MLTTVALAVTATGLASANGIITFGVDPTTGLNTVTQTITFPSGTLGNQLATYSGFAALGISGNYVAGDTTMDYQFTNVVQSFSVKNNDTQTDTVNFGELSEVTLDVGTTLTNSPSKDLKTSCNDIANAANTLSLGAGCANNLTLVSVTNQVIASGGTFTLGGTPITTTLGIGTGNCGNFGDTHKGDGCAANLLNDSQYSGVSNVSFGVDDFGQFTFSAASNTSNANLTFNSTTTESGQAEITYEYSVPSGTPEPTTLALMGGALIGLGLIGKKRLKKN